jgi:cytoskeletal protein CcmA (bactofilin family)
LYIDGKVMGTICLPGCRVTVGRNGQVSADIYAREVMVLGEVQGNIDASERVDISSEGSLVGNLITKRVIIAEGAFFKGIIDIHTPVSGNDERLAPGVSSAEQHGAAVYRSGVVQTAFRTLLFLPATMTTISPSTDRSLGGDLQVMIREVDTAHGLGHWRDRASYRNSLSRSCVTSSRKADPWVDGAAGSSVERRIR